MTNHPNRNWRQRMKQAADQFFEAPVGKVLADVPLAGATPASLIGLRNRLREAYLCGYRDGRKQDTSCSPSRKPQPF